jgi:hypothetical protein
METSAWEIAFIGIGFVLSLAAVFVVSAAIVYAAYTAVRHIRRRHQGIPAFERSRRLRVALKRLLLAAVVCALGVGFLVYCGSTLVGGLYL